MSLTLDGVSVDRDSKRVLQAIKLQLNCGERWALVGGNGAGKTQLLKLLSADVWPVPGDRGKRIYRIGKVAVDLIEAKARIVYIGAELQDKYARYDWNLSVRDIVATGLQRSDLLLQPVTPAHARRVARMLEACALTRLAARRFLSLSYGQKRLTLLARALVQRPDWLLLDEFYNGLDAAFRRRVDSLLAAARRRGQSWIVAAHRAADVPPGTGGLIELRAGQLVAAAKLERADLARLASAANESRRAPRARSVKLASRPRAGRRRLLLRLRGVDLYVEYRHVLRAVDWELNAGDHWAIFGGNGAGKSSFLKLLYGDLSPALGGRIERRGFPPGTPVAAWKRQVGLVSPELQSDYAIDVTVADVVASGLHASIGLVDEASAPDRLAARRWLKFFGLASLAARRPRQLSYGQMRRVLIARALAGKARLLLLDEPFTGLDPGQRAAMKRLLEKLMANGVTIVAAVHHAEDLPRGMTHALRLHKQRAVAREL